MSETKPVIQLVNRLLFVLLSSVMMVFFSEKAYWYPPGYPIVELVLFYAIPVYSTLWAIDYFRVKRLSGMILISAFYAFLVEGVMTPVIFEGGLFDPLMPIYFIGWHGLLACVFGWYLIRKWLVEGAWKSILIASMLFGIFWGIWSITYWAPASLVEWADMAAIGEPSIGDPRIPAEDFGIFAGTFTLMFVIAHWAMGRLGWQRSFRPSRIEGGIVFLALLFMFGTLSVPTAPFGFLKLAVLLIIVAVPLYFNRRRETPDSLLSDLTAPVKRLHLLPLFLMPILATIVYGILAGLNLSDAALTALVEDVPLIQGLLGALFLIWAVFDTFWRGERVIVAGSIPQESIN
ncbi:MAG: hypothetical protein AAGD96_26345 [Chloroflexota bacterium]